MSANRNTLEAAAGTLRPADVHATLSRHMLADGFEVVVDLRTSKGSYLHDARSGISISSRSFHPDRSGSTIRN